MQAEAQEEGEEMNEWLDKYGFIKTRKHQDSTGNPCLYTVLYGELGLGFIPVTQLFKEELGVLWRTPENTYGQNSHDEYSAYGVRVLKIGNIFKARQMLLAMIKKLGYMKNVPFRKPDQKLKWKERMLWRLKEWTAPWMGRFPNVWLVMFAAAFPNRISRLFSMNFLRLLMAMQSENPSDASGLQLHWLNLYAIHLMGNSKPLREFIDKYDMSKIMDGYYDSDHPILEGYRNYENYHSR